MNSVEFLRIAQPGGGVCPKGVGIRWETVFSSDEASRIILKQDVGFGWGD
jgi:hypothetical protein